jgi:hypothetical protein
VFLAFQVSFKGQEPGTGTFTIPVCPLHVVSPRDLWSFFLPRWQFDVNVNVNVHNLHSQPMVSSAFFLSRSL